MTDHVRPAQAQDRDGILAVARATGMFDPIHATDLAVMLDAALAGEVLDAAWLVAVAEGLEGNAVAAVALVMPEAMTHGTWNLQFIAVDPQRQGGGFGSALLAEVERRLLSQGARLLLVETSSLDGYDTARGFYGSRGFAEEARVRDFYQAGEDKIVFRKRLDSASRP